MRPFLADNFLLYNETAERLYHEHAAVLPIIDYHNHLSPAAIATNAPFPDLTSAWLAGDHYKWRAMRANGIDETRITGAATPREKFTAWAATVPQTMGNPLYHWTHLELRRYFDITDLLEPGSAAAVWEAAGAQLPDLPPRTLLERMRVEVVCTTDDPTDDLAHHRAYAAAPGHFRLYPTFRPDQLVLIAGPHFLAALRKLESLTTSPLRRFGDLVDALEQRIGYFHAHGCRLSDHGLPHLFALDYRDPDLDRILQKARRQQAILPLEAAQFASALLYELGLRYHRYGWTMQFHLGPLRNTNTRLARRLGADAGTDSIGDFPQAVPLARYLDRLDRDDQLPRTILYNLNPRDNALFATMAGNFNDGSQPGKVQWGAAWWFLDQRDGMEAHLRTLGNMGLLSRFVGMLTDSRSFLSFPRHEYFRRILCQFIGERVTRGELPADLDTLGRMVRRICYHNARNYFHFGE